MDQTGEGANTKEMLRHLARLAGLEWDEERREHLAPALEGLMATAHLLMAAEVGNAEPASIFDPRPRSGQ